MTRCTAQWLGVPIGKSAHEVLLDLVAQAEWGTVAGTALVDGAGVLRHADERAQRTLGARVGAPLHEVVSFLSTEPRYLPALTERRPCVMVGGRAGVALAPTDEGFLVAFLKGSPAEAAFEATPAMMLVVDGQGRIVEANAQTALHFHEPEGRTLDELIPSPVVLQVVKSTLAGHRTELVSFEWMSPAGHKVMELRCRQVPGSPLCVLKLNDVTSERRTAEEREQLLEALHQSQKLDAIGQLASGVAHDMNNVLAVVQTCAGALRDEVKEALHKADAEQILLAAQRARDLLNQLLAFARKTPTKTERFDMVEMTREAVGLATRLLPTNVRLNLHATAEFCEVLGDRSQLQQAILNVCLNARDAMPAGGTITVSLACENRRVICTIADSGIGMPKEVLQRAFEPFFSTKKRGSGTGLGLSMAYTSLRAHRGDIRLESTLGQGTRVTMWLPREPTEQEVEMSTPIPAARGVAVVVDDDEVTRNVLGRFLRKLGYSVQLVASGEEAVSLLRGGLHPALVVCDLVMPGLDGNQTLTQLRALAPQVRVVMTSGFLDDQGASEVRSAGANGFLFKPFSMDDVAEVLAGLPQ